MFSIRDSAKGFIKRIVNLRAVNAKAIKEKILKERKLISLSFAAALVFTLAVGALSSRAYSDQISGDISNELIRFHVRANSDTEEDQILKNHIREKVLEYLRSGLSASSSKGETYELLYSRLEEIRVYAERIVREKGYNYRVEAMMTREFFPTKVYGDIALPAGEYDTLRIDIGKAAGQNWWCVLFPPLCYVDITRKEIPEEEKNMLKSVLSDESYELIACDDNPQMKIKFKTVEIWQSIMAEISSVTPAMANDNVIDEVKSDSSTALEPEKQVYGPKKSDKLTSGIPAFVKSDALAINDYAAVSSISIAEEAPDPRAEHELWLLATVINGEARGEQYLGQVAVGAVVLNRVSHPSFPNSVEEVIYQPGAFDAVRDGQINLTPSESCIRAAQDALAGNDPTNGAIYYWNPKIATCRWISTIPVTIAIGNHNFGV